MNYLRMNRIPNLYNDTQYSISFLVTPSISIHREPEPQMILFHDHFDNFFPFGHSTNSNIPARQTFACNRSTNLPETQNQMKLKHTDRSNNSVLEDVLYSAQMPLRERVLVHECIHSGEDPHLHPLRATECRRRLVLLSRGITTS